MECKVLPRLPATLFVLMKLWDSFVCSLNIQLFWILSGKHQPKLLWHEKIDTNMHLHTHAANLEEDIQLQDQADMAKQNLFWNGRTSGSVHKWYKVMLICLGLYYDWMLFDKLKKFWKCYNIVGARLSCVFPWVVVAAVDSECVICTICVS